MSSAGQSADRLNLPCSAPAKPLLMVLGTLWARLQPRLCVPPSSQEPTLMMGVMNSTRKPGSLSREG